MRELLERQTEHESVWDQEDKGFKKKKKNERKETKMLSDTLAQLEKKYLHDSTDEKIKENNVLYYHGNVLMTMM